jgi:hypothetical protein
MLGPRATPRVWYENLRLVHRVHAILSFVTLMDCEPIFYTATYAMFWPLLQYLFYTLTGVAVTTI